MKSKELFDYLKGFSEDANLTFIVADIGNRVAYDVRNVCIDDSKIAPIICLDICSPEAFSPELIRAAEEAETEE